MADYVVQYSVASNYVLGMWPRTTSDNRATAIADGKLTVDGVDVVIGWSETTTDIGFLLLTDPTLVLTTLEASVAEVTGGGTDVEERTDSERDPEYEFQNPIG